MANADFWILRPFNLLFWLVTAAFALLLIAASLLLRGRSVRTRELVLTAASLLTLSGFFLYKYALSLDEEFRVLNAAMGGFNWWGELPLQLCNINMLLLPVAVLSKNRGLMSFCFFVGPLGAVMAITMPVAGFYDCSLLLPRMLGFYGTHFMVVIQGLALVSFGLFRPRFRDLPGAVLAVLLIALVVFFLDVLLRRSGLHPKANYFFAMETEGNPLLEIFHRLVPYPYLYLLPSLIILCPYMLIVTLPFALSDRRKAAAKSEEAAV